MHTSHQQLQLSWQICLHGNLGPVLTLWLFSSTQDESLKTRKKEREDLGVELYGVQQELARYQMMLERNHDNYTQLNQQRQREEQQLSEVRGLYKDTQLTFNKEKKKGQACFAFICPGQELYSSSKVKQLQTILKLKSYMAFDNNVAINVQTWKTISITPLLVEGLLTGLLSFIMQSVSHMLDTTWRTRMK